MIFISFPHVFSVSKIAYIIHIIWSLIKTLTAKLMAMSADIFTATVKVIAQVLKSLSGPAKRDSLLGPSPLSS